MGFRNGLTRLFAGLALLLGSMLTTPALAAGLMTPTNSGLPPLQIREQHVTVDVEDGYAITEVEQVFHNPNDRTWKPTTASRSRSAAPWPSSRCGSTASR